MLGKKRMLLIIVTGLILVYLWTQNRVLTYQNKEWNITLSYPGNWEFIEEPRNTFNDFYLRTTKGFIINQSSALIHVLIDEFPKPTDKPIELEIKMETYLKDMAEMTHVFSSLEIIEVSNVMDKGKHQIISAIVSVPTDGIAVSYSFNNMERTSEDVFQTIEIYILRNNQSQDIIIELYKGTNEKLNAQATAIVHSVRFIEE